MSEEGKSIHWTMELIDALASGVRAVWGLKSPNLSISKAIDEVIVHHADCLHVGIEDGGADEAETPALEILAERVGLARGRRNLPDRLPSIQLGPSAHETPAVGVETSELFLNCAKRPRVAHRGFDLQPVSNDSRIRCELLNSFPGISRHFPRIELTESLAIALPFSEHGGPAEPGLRPFQNQELEVLPVVVDRHAPFPVVIPDHQRVAARPCTSFRDHEPQILGHRRFEGPPVLARTGQLFRREISLAEWAEPQPTIEVYAAPGSTIRLVS
jgi:hypothetical protein